MSDLQKTLNIVPMVGEMQHLKEKQIEAGVS